jgi:hypothetical protein
VGQDHCPARSLDLGRLLHLRHFHRRRLLHGIGTRIGFGLVLDTRGILSNAGRIRLRRPRVFEIGQALGFLERDGSGVITRLRSATATATPSAPAPGPFLGPTFGLRVLVIGVRGLGRAVASSAAAPSPTPPAPWAIPDVVVRQIEGGDLRKTRRGGLSALFARRGGLGALFARRGGLGALFARRGGLSAFFARRIGGAVFREIGFP